MRLFDRDGVVGSKYKIYVRAVTTKVNRMSSTVSHHTFVTTFGIFCAVSCINGYQRYLSKSKGYTCAHRALHKGDSCSEAVKKMVQAQGPVRCLGNVKGRFRACAAAAAEIKEAAAGEKSGDGAKPEQEKEGLCKPTDACDIAGTAVNVSGCFP
jgi:putative component of membrane protein insertase Oxa1/YidC/SpoIIIJ protein YidD